MSLDARAGAGLVEWGWREAHVASAHVRVWAPAPSLVHPGLACVVNGPPCR